MANLEAREELRRLDRERFRGMTPEEVSREKRVSRRAGYAAHQFLDIEAEESEGEVESCIAAEDGFEAAVEDSRPLDSKGEPFICFVGKRLVKILSNEYFDLSGREKREVKRLERLHKDITDFC